MLIAGHNNYGCICCVHPCFFSAFNLHVSHQCVCSTMMFCKFSNAVFGNMMFKLMNIANVINHAAGRKFELIG